MAIFFIEDPSPLRKSPRLEAVRRVVDKSPATINGSQHPAARLFGSIPISTSLEIVSQEDGPHGKDDGKKPTQLQKRSDSMKTYRTKKGKGKGKDENAEVVEKGKEDASSTLKKREKKKSLPPHKPKGQPFSVGEHARLFHNFYFHRCGEGDSRLVVDGHVSPST